MSVAVDIAAYATIDYSVAYHKRYHNKRIVRRRLPSTFSSRYTSRGVPAAASARRSRATREDAQTGIDGFVAVRLMRRSYARPPPRSRCRQRREMTAIDELPVQEKRREGRALRVLPAPAPEGWW